MKPQTTGLLLCALLLSTFGHEFSHRLKTSQARKNHLSSRAGDNNTNECYIRVPCTSTTTATPNSEDNSSTSGSSGETPTTESTDPNSGTTEPGSDNSTATDTSNGEGTSVSPGGSPTTDNSNGNETSTLYPDDSTTTNSSNGDGNTTISSGGSGAILLINSTTSLIGVVNAELKIAFIVDVNHNFVAVFNGSSGAVIIINLQNRVAIYISGNSADGQTWNGSVSFESYFRSLVSLQALYKYASQHGERITTTNVRVEVSILIRTVLVFLGEQNVNAKGVLDLFIQYSLSITAVFRGSLKRVLTLFGSVIINVRDSRRIINIFQGLARIFSQIKGGINVLIRLNVRFDLSVILNARSSIEIFIYIYTQISSHVDLKPLIRLYSQNVFALFADFSGNSVVGIDGIITVLARVIDLEQHKNDINVNALITILIQYFSINSGDNTSVYQEFRQSLQLLLNFLQKSGLSEEFSALIVVIKAILNEDYKINGIDIILIIKILAEANSDRLHLLVRILVVLEAVVKISVSVGVLLHRLILLILQGEILIIRALVPEIEFDASVNILVYIFRGIRLSDLRQKSFYEIVRNLPIIKQIISAIDGGLGTCSHTSIQIILTDPDFLKYAHLIIDLIIKVLPQINEGHHVEDSSKEHLSANQRQHPHEGYVIHQRQHHTENKHLHNSVKINDKRHGAHQDRLHESHGEHYNRQHKHHERKYHHEKQLHHDRKHTRHEKKSHTA